MNGNATLTELDKYLRAIWLECCGHMSHFTLGNNAWGQELPMNKKVYQLLEDGMEMTHVYDFGSSTITTIIVSDARWGKPMTSEPIFLMARNNMLELLCEHCNKNATWLLQDYNTFDGDELLCEKHQNDVMNNEEEEYDEVALIELVNSPRCGVCGYDGPANTPYQNAQTFWDVPTTEKSSSASKSKPKKQTGQQSLFD